MGSESAGGGLRAEDLAALREAAAHPLDPSAAVGVEWVQTHLSHVFLTGERVYKFRKAVDLGFVNFLSRAERNADCLREVELNRRLAPDVYLGVAPLRVGRGTARVEAPAETLAPDAGAAPEHCVVMRRLPAGRDALSLLERGVLGAPEIDRVAERVARFHAGVGLGVPAPFASELWRERCVAPLEDCVSALERSEAAVAASAALDRTRARGRAFARERADRFERRRLAGRAVDAHGDLHLQHVWFEGDAGDPRIIDCLEFSEALRRVDAASEVAFLAMDLRYRGAPGLAERFLRRYARDADDFDLYAVVDFFAGYRAAVRAKVAALAAADPSIEAAQRARATESARRHLELAVDLLAPRGAGALLLVAGAVGTGKTTAAEAFADALGGVVLSSDRVRKSEAGVAAGERLAAEWGEGAYRPEARGRVYTALFERARPVLEAGRVAVLDATFSARVHREGALRLADALGLPRLLVEVRCTRERALERLARRAAAGRDASDAGPGLYAASAAAFEPADEWPADERCVLHTDREGWRRDLAQLVARLHRAPAP